MTDRFKKVNDYGGFSPFLSETDAIMQSSIPDIFQILPPHEQTSPPDYAITYSKFSRSLEVAKELGEDLIKILGSAETADAQKYRLELSHTYPGVSFELNQSSNIKVLSNSSEVRRLKQQGLRPWYFRAYHAHGFPFLDYDLHAPRVLFQSFVEYLATVSAGMIQVCWMSYPWGSYAEVCANILNKISSRISQGMERQNWKTVKTPGGFSIPSPFGLKETVPHPWVGSVYDMWGAALGKLEMEQAHQTGLVVSIQGVIISANEPDLTPLFSSVQTDYDSVIAVNYTDPRTIHWIRRRVLPNPGESLSQLNKYLEYVYRLADLGESPRDRDGWRSGRPYISDLCTRPAKLPIFVHLPQNKNLPIRFSSFPETPEAVLFPRAKSRFGEMIDVEGTAKWGETAEELREEREKEEAAYKKWREREKNEND